MSRHAFGIGETPAVPVLGSDEVYPVRRIFCVGRNYEAHAKEMGVSTREPPFFFTKFPSSLVPSGARLRYPPGTKDYHYEGELVVAIGGTGFEVPGAEANRLVFGYATGLDMTRRDLQFAARDKGRPWDTGKNFEQSAPVTAIRPFAQGGALERGRIELAVNGKVRQSADIADMIWSVPEIIGHLSLLYTLAPGDLIYTGTPAGVGAVVAGDAVQVRIEGLPTLDVAIDGR